MLVTRAKPDLDDAGPGNKYAPFGAQTGVDLHRSRQEYIAIEHAQKLELDSGIVQFWFNTERMRGDKTLISKAVGRAGT